MKILLTGATGFVGKALEKALVEQGHTLHSLTRNVLPDEESIRRFTWDIKKKQIDPNCIQGVDAIIHLAGSNIAAKPWSKSVRAEILNSRTDSIRLIYSLLANNADHTVKTIISSSATGYYSDRGNEELTEDKAPADDFLGQTCNAWENAVEEGKTFGLRCVFLRSGIVLDRYGGALPKLAAPIKLGLGTSLGHGKQWIPWIHLEDAVAQYIFALEHDGLNGPYNMVAPEPVTNEMLTRELAKALNKPLWLPPIPAVLIKTVMGKMSEIVLSSTKASAERISNAGFKFKYPGLEQAIKSIYG